MSMSTHIHQPTSMATSCNIEGKHWWLNIEDAAGNTVTIHTTREIAEAVAGAFAEATKPGPSLLEQQLRASVALGEGPR